MANNNDKMAYQRLFRIQGGIEPCRSREFISIVDGSRIKASIWKAIYIGDSEHMLHFLLNKRLNVGKIKNIPDDVSEYGLHVIEMYVPYWFSHLLESYARSQFDTREKGLKKVGFPKLVDKTMPGRSYEVSRYWTDLLVASCVYAKDNPINGKDDIYGLLEYEEIEKEPEKLKPLNIEELSKIMKMCQIQPETLQELSDKWGLEISEGGR